MQFIEIGKFNLLKVLKRTPQGFYLGDPVEEILLPNKYIPEGLEVDDELNVFIYTDSEDRLIATTLTPKVERDQFGLLKVVHTSNAGAFMDWGLEKDLFVPFRQQEVKMEEGQSYIIQVYLDELTDRLAGSSRVNKFLEFEDIPLTEGEQVNLLICQETELGFYAIINEKYKGLLYKNQVFKRLKIGDRTIGFVKTIREDLKIDLQLERVTPELIDAHAQQILDRLKASDGFLPLHDKSDPEQIKLHLEMSKKNFKKGIGTLYKQRIIALESEGIRLL